MRLTRQHARADLRTLTDMLMTVLANIEDAFLLAGQRPGVDYKFSDIVRIASAPGTADFFKDKELTLVDAERDDGEKTDRSIPPQLPNRQMKDVAQWTFPDYLLLLHLGKNATMRGDFQKILASRFGIAPNKTGGMLTALDRQFEQQMREFNAECIDRRLRGDA